MTPPVEKLRSGISPGGERQAAAAAAAQGHEGEDVRGRNWSDNPCQSPAGQERQGARDLFRSALPKGTLTARMQPSNSKHKKGDDPFAKEPFAQPRWRNLVRATHRHKDKRKVSFKETGRSSSKRLDKEDIEKENIKTFSNLSTF